MPISCLSGIFLESAEQDCKENWHVSVTLFPGIRLQTQKPPGVPASSVLISPVLPPLKQSKNLNWTRIHLCPNAPARIVKVFTYCRQKISVIRPCRSEKVWGYSWGLHLWRGGLSFSQLSGTKWFWDTFPWSKCIVDFIPCNLGNILKNEIFVADL